MKIIKYGTITFNKDGKNVTFEDFSFDMGTNETMDAWHILDMTINQLRHIQETITFEFPPEYTKVDGPIVHTKPSPTD